MATLKKGAVNQILFTMVDKTDFASIESGLASGFTAVIFGVAHGGSTAAASVAVSKAISVVNSGIFKATLKATETASYDQILLRIAHASAATQMLLFDLPTANDADFSDYLSKLQSRVPSLMATNSGMDSKFVKASLSAASAVWAHAKATSTLAYGAVAASTASDALSYLQSTLASKISGLSAILSDVTSVLASTYSDVVSMLSTVSQLRVRTNWSTLSDMASKVASHVWAVNINGASMASNIASQVWAHAIGNSVAGRVSQVRVRTGWSTTSDMTSKIAKIIWDTPYSNFTTASTMGSALGTNKSQFSGLSDIISKMYVQTTAIGDASDIASAVWGQKWDIHSTASTFGSRIAKWAESGINIRASDMSRIESIVALGPTAADATSIAREVWMFDNTDASVLKASMFGSRFMNLATSAYLSNIHSDISAAISNVYSLVSDITSALAITATASDVASAVWAQKWDIHSTASTFGSRIAKWAESGINIRTSDMSTLSNYAGSPVITSDTMSKIGVEVWKLKWDINSTASSFGSAFEVLTSRVSAIRGISTSIASSISTISKIYSQTTSIASDVISMLSTVSQLRVRAAYSTISDLSSKIVSHVWASTKGASALSLLSQLRVRAAYSTVSDLTSKISSRIWAQVDASDIASAVWAHAKGGSVLTYGAVAASAASDANSWVRSSIGDKSDIASAVWGEKWDVHSTASTFGSIFEQMTTLSNYLSDLASKIISRVAVTGVSLTSNTLSDLKSAIANGPTTDKSDIASAVWSEKYNVYSATASSFGSKYMKLATSAFVSDVQSYLSNAISKATSIICSHVSGVTATINYNSVASAIWDAKYDTHSDASSFGSAFEKIYSHISGISNILSAVYVHTTSMLSQISDTQSYLQTTLASKISGLSNILSAVYVDTADISNVASQIYARQASQYVRINGSLLSGISNILSAVYVHTTSMHSQTSNINSKLGSFIGNMDSYMSDISSRVWAASRASNILSKVSDLYSFVSDALSIVSAGVGLNASALSDIASVVDARLDTAFTDATGLTANGLKDRIRTMKWILQNKMNVIKLNGNTEIFKDDDIATGLSTAAALTSDATSVLRKRLL